MGNHKIEWAGKRKANTITFTLIADHCHGFVDKGKVFKDFDYLLYDDLEFPELLLFTKPKGGFDLSDFGDIDDFGFKGLLRKALPKAKIIFNDDYPENFDGEWITPKYEE